MGKKFKLKQREEQAKQERFAKDVAQWSKRAAEKPQAEPLIKAFENYKDKFIRGEDAFVLRTRSDHRDKQLLEMARHLFGKYRVPRILENAWGAYEPYPRSGRELPRWQADRRGGQERAQATNPNLNRVDFRKWYVCVATGGSLYKEHTKDFLTKKETHAFLTAPSELDMCQGVVWAVARCAGVDNGAALRLARSKLAERPFDKFWLDVIRYFCLEGNTPGSVNQVNDLLDYLAHRKNEDAHFRVLGSGQSLVAMERRMEQWHRALARTKDLSGIEWGGVDIDDHTIEQKDPQNKELVIVWSFKQIKTGKDLAAEGTAMRHCVFGYKTRCVRGDCSIWSMSRTDAFGHSTRRLTIEVSKYGEIVQKRGLANRMPRAEEEHILEQWSRAVRFRNRGSW